MHDWRHGGQQFLRAHGRCATARLSDNVLSIGGFWSAGDRFAFDLASNKTSGANGSPRVMAIAGRIKQIAQDHRDDIEAIFPKVQRRVGGYNLDA